MGDIIEFKKREEKPITLDTELYINMLDYLTDLMKNSPGSFNRQNIDLRRKTLLKDASDAHIISEINASSSMVWSSKPAYYNALVAEVRSRHLIPGL